MAVIGELPRPPVAPPISPDDGRVRLSPSVQERLKYIQGITRYAQEHPKEFYSGVDVSLASGRSSSYLGSSISGWEKVAGVAKSYGVDIRAGGYFRLPVGAFIDAAFALGPIDFQQQERGRRAAAAIHKGTTNGAQSLAPTVGVIFENSDNRLQAVSVELDTPKIAEKPRLKTHALLLTEDKLAADLLEPSLREYGISATTAVLTGENAVSIEDVVARLVEIHPDILLLRLPNVDDNIAVMERIHKTLPIPTIILCEDRNRSSIVQAYGAGASQYMSAWTPPIEIVAYARAIIRHRATEVREKKSIVQVGNAKIDLDRWQVTKTRNGVEEKIMINRKQLYYLLRFLALNPNRIITYNDILTKIWGREYYGALTYLRLGISLLREILEDDPQQPKIIKTHKGIGYSFEADQ